MKFKIFGKVAVKARSVSQGVRYRRIQGYYYGKSKSIRLTKSHNTA